ncbi:MAG: hypothetical protein ACREBC_34835 [Pyrinomonadaceae bacterium]
MTEQTDEVGQAVSTPNASGLPPEDNNNNVDNPQRVEAGQIVSAQPQRVMVSTPGVAPSFVYALGRVVPRFPRLALEKEFAQATGREATAGLTDRQAVHEVLSQRQNRYLSRQLCWVLTIEGLETYILAACRT